MRLRGDNRGLLLLTAAMFLVAAEDPPPTFVSFEPQARRLTAATREYEEIWAADGARIVAALEGATGAEFPDGPIEAIVHEGPSMTAYDGRSMRLSARLAPKLKQAVLVHELGHRLAATLPRAPGLDDHRLLYLFLYDVWTELYGRTFADRLVKLERRSRFAYYAESWDWALAMTREQRRARLRTLVAGSDARSAAP